jgi:hypothetical protein
MEETKTSHDSHPVWLQDLSDGPVRRWLTNRLGPVECPTSVGEHSSNGSELQADPKTPLDSEAAEASCTGPSPILSAPEEVHSCSIDDGQSSAELASELSWRMHRFLGKAEQRKAEFEQWFSADKMTGTVFGQLSTRSETWYHLLAR